MQDYTNVKGYAQALATVQANLSPRFRQLDTCDRFVDGTVYDGRPDFFTGVTVPLAERKPCVKYPIAEIAIESYSDIIFGEKRFPVIKVSGVKSDELSATMKRSKLKTALVEALENAMGCGSAALIFGVRGERPFIDRVPAKWCEPELDPAIDNRVLKLVISYPYIKVEKDDSGRYKAVAMWFRRVIDDETDTTYKPQVAQRNGIEPKNWTADPDRTFPHELGFCPVVWYPHLRGVKCEGSYDGHALHEHQLDEITQHDLAISQRQRAAFTAGDPQYYEIGVEKGYNPSEGGRPQMIPATPNGGAPQQGQARPMHAYVQGGRGKTRKRGVTNVWQYESKDVKVGILELSASAIEAIDNNAKDLRIKLCDAMAFVPIDPEHMPRTLSGKALEMLRARQLARADKIRPDVAESLIAPSIAMLCRVAGLKKDADHDDVETEWPPYEKPDYQERSTLLAAEVPATAQAITLVKSPTFARVAQRRLAGLIVDNMTDEEEADVEDEIEENTPDEIEDLEEEEQENAAAQATQGGGQQGVRKPAGGVQPQRGQAPGGGGGNRPK